MIRPLGDRIVVRPHPGAGMIGRIFIPDAKRSTRNQTFRRADVVAVGVGCSDALKLAKTVIVSEYFGDEIEHEEQKLFIGRERDVFAVDDAGNLMAVTDRVICKPMDDPEKVGVLFMPQRENVERQQRRGMVIAVGSSARCGVELGDVVLILKHLYVEANLDGRKYLLIQDSELLVKL